MEKGLVVGCDKKLEWLLPWWWKHYSSHNDFPVAFFDFGMSEEAKMWCAKKGSLHFIHAFAPICLMKEEMATAKWILWESQYGPDVWKVRTAWLKKPMALLQSPFDLSLWLDLDCIVNGNLQSVFDFLGQTHDFSVFQYEKSNSFWNYNSGVILFKKNAEIIKLWVERVINFPDEFPGDEDYLNQVIQDHHPNIRLMPAHFNWSRLKKDNEEALITHFHGGEGKIALLKQINSVFRV